MVDEYDANKLKQARKLLVEVYEFNFASHPFAFRLATIISKLDKLIDQFTEHESTECEVDE